MTKANRKASAAKAPAAPRLVGDAGPATADQAGEAEPAAGEDNNKHLAFLEGRTVAFTDQLGGLGIVVPAGTDIFDAAIAAIVEARGQADEFAGTVQELADRLADLNAEIDDATRDIVPAEGQSRLASLAAALTKAGERIGELSEMEQRAANECDDMKAEIGALFLAIKDREGYDISLGGNPTENVVQNALATIASLEAQIGALTDEGETAEDARKLHKAAVKNVVELFVDLPDTAAITLRFAEGTEFIRQVLPIEVPRDKLLPVGSKVSLDMKIDFEPGIAPAFVTHAFLIAGKKTLRCEISALRIGGGAMAQIPAGFLEF